MDNATDPEKSIEWLINKLKANPASKPFVPRPLYIRGTAEERFMNKFIELPNGCWQWQGDKSKKGYGRFWVGNKFAQAHRYAYELIKGPIPEGLEIDHLCHNPGCVNPDHMQLVTGQENIERGWQGKKLLDPPFFIDDGR